MDHETTGSGVVTKHTSWRNAAKRSPGCRLAACRADQAHTDYQATSWGALLLLARNFPSGTKCGESRPRVLWALQISTIKRQWLAGEIPQHRESSTTQPNGYRRPSAAQTVTAESRNGVLRRTVAHVYRRPKAGIINVCKAAQQKV